MSVRSIYADVASGSILRGNSPRSSCVQCVLKHLGQASALFQESVQGYPSHRWLAIGHLAEAESEIQERSPDFASRIRMERLSCEGSDVIPDCEKLISECLVFLDYRGKLAMASRCGDSCSSGLIDRVASFFVSNRVSGGL